MANALFEHLSAKLPISRLQRDLTDSTVLRNIGVPYAHTLIACKSLLKGFSKVSVNTSAIEADLGENWAVVAEAISNHLTQSLSKSIRSTQSTYTHRRKNQSRNLHFTIHRRTERTGKPEKRTAHHYSIQLYRGGEGVLIRVTMEDEGLFSTARCS